MKRLKILKNVLHYTKADKILWSYIVFVLLDALVIWLAEPTISTYRDSLWYCCVTISTAGFGDFVATVSISRIATVLLMIYSVLVIAIVTGVVVNYYNQLISIKQKETVAALINKLERLPELSKEELQEMADNAARIHKNHMEAKNE